MSSAGRAHKLSSGMLVSGLPPKPRTPNHSSAAPPFTGERASSRPLSLPILRTSGPLLSPTGLITSSSAAPIGEKKGAGVTAAEREREIGFWFWVPKAWVAVTVFAFAVAIGVGLFVWVEVGRPQIFGTFAGAAAAVGAAGLWNWGRGRRELERYFRACPDSSVSLRSLPVGELVKLTGIIYKMSSSTQSAISKNKQQSQVNCECNLPCIMFTARTEQNRGRKFVRCSRNRSKDDCGYFQWMDETDESIHHTLCQLREQNELLREQNELLRAQNELVIKELKSISVAMNTISFAMKFFICFVVIVVLYKLCN